MWIVICHSLFSLQRFTKNILHICRYSMILVQSGLFCDTALTYQQAAFLYIQQDFSEVSICFVIYSICELIIFTCQSFLLCLHFLVQCHLLVSAVTSITHSVLWSASAVSHVFPESARLLSSLWVKRLNRYCVLIDQHVICRSVVVDS